MALRMIPRRVQLGYVLAVRFDVGIDRVIRPVQFEDGSHRIGGAIAAATHFYRQVSIAHRRDFDDRDFVVAHI